MRQRRAEWVLLAGYSGSGSNRAWKERSSSLCYLKRGKREWNGVLK
ncbi:hypothetical protein [Paenibacillus herberti]|nr:hypothetical protein [Paenibacillus herberti]